MTLAELGQRMSNTEFELWMAEELQRSVECPSCGHEARDMNEVVAYDVKCPICGTKYQRMGSANTWQSSAHRTHSEA